MKIYKPSNVVPTSGYAWFLLTALVTGGVAGGVVSFIGAFFYLILLFPLGMGLVGAGATRVAIKSGKVRNPNIALLFGALTGASIYGSMHVFDYFRFQQQLTKELREFYSTEIEQEVTESGRTEEQVLQDATDAFLLDEVGQTGFWGYLNFFARQGFSISRMSSGGIPVGGAFTWAYWAIKLGVIVVISGLSGSGTAQEPFNEKRNEWYEAPKRVGNVPEEASQQFVDLLNNDNYEEAGTLINSSDNISVPSVEVYLYQPPENLTDDSILSLNNASMDKHQEVQVKRFLLGHLSSSQWSKLDKAIKR